MLHEENRPAGWEGFIGNGKAAGAARMAASRAKASGRPFAMTIQGPSGTGKTTLAWLIARELTSCPDWDVCELDGDKCTVEAVRSLTQEGILNTRAMGGFRVVIVNECHAMTPRAVQAWLTLLERLPQKSAVIFTTTEGRGDSELFGNFTGPFVSRSIPICLTSQGLAQAFAARAQEVAEREGLGGAPAKAYLRLVQDCKNNMREVYGRIEAGEMLRDANDSESANAA